MYRGKPSAACSSCRARRITCDKKKPQCTQCTRMRIDCTGYRDPLDQNFRDESESVVKRAQKSYKKASGVGQSKRCAQKDGKAYHCADSCDIVPLKLYQDCAIPNAPMLLNLSQSIEDVAVAHFMSSYIPGSHFDYLPAMYGQLSTEMVLTAAVHAASMASLGRELGQPSIMAMARRSYGKALQKMDCALADPSIAANDTTLISVLLLGLFEAMVWASPRTPHSWTAHTRGALALIKLRGPQQVETPVGRTLFVQVANIICVSSIQQKTRIPPELVALIKTAMHDECGAPRYGLTRLTGEVSNLMADIDEGGMTAEEIIRATQSVDEKYVSFSKSIPQSLKYRAITINKPRPEVYNQTVYQYPSHRAAQLWNSYRMTRILLNEIIHGYAAYVSPCSRAEIQDHATENVQQMAVEICASIPQFTNPLEFSVPLGRHFPSSAGLAPVSKPESLSLKASAASLLWPLSVTRSASIASEDVRAYSVERLKFVGREFRMPQAEKVALEMGEFDSLQDGLHMFYVS
ncbi:uncharacterized protein K460DRAFT_340939 [Cucurbitaria berberidis CBS 394.84]|uniref:Zn(2)-C6 fungal-type domain-containing protein n=1 Tax=Cucurbitaria berberidis CBS 394.84 TaxID=1168544 RepID=A0A9P4L5W8_9PLEO|nr:uncharacterized protein K460DRAFT_340939 [Cucurbitaria berberidis CBS 394.84]KAF1843140.1 hypothetical protein K460DRAFT_340939 [Cucurbitaria berberidis CBS 394.84]